MAATPISARPGIEHGVGLAGIWLPLVLQMAAAPLAFWALAWRTASRVSAVSPDWEMAITSVARSRTGSR